jgi:drug/metabolite transporter (DMT)-like permease
LLLAAAALLFSTGGAAIKAVTLTGWQVACFRSGIAAAALLAAIPSTRRGWTWRMAPVAAGYAGTLLLFVLSTRLTTSANAIFLQSTAPLYLLVIGPLFLREPIHGSDLLFMIGVGLGMTCIFAGSNHAVATAPNPPLGNLLGVGSGLTWASTLAGLRWLARGKDSRSALPTVALGNVLAFLAALPMALPVTDPRPYNAAVILYLGVVQIGLAYICLTSAIRHVPAFQATTVLWLEPVMNPIWTWVVHRERPGGWALAGGAVILGATIANAWWQQRACISVTNGRSPARDAMC